MGKVEKRTADFSGQQYFEYCLVSAIIIYFKHRNNGVYFGVDDNPNV